MPRRTLVQTRVTIEERAALEQIAQQNKVSVADVIREAVNDLLESYDATIRLKPSQKIR